ncbi:MAG: hypothetical protein WA948_10880 [Pontixanthobacter sp.]
MTDDRTESAVQRIEAALTRIAACADGPPDSAQSNGDLSNSAPSNAASSSSASVTALIERHETLREVVDGTLSELDDLLSRLDR